MSMLKPHPASNPDDGPLLEVRDLVIEFETDRGPLRANDGVSYTVRRGETFAIVGESGSGKSVSARAVMGLLQSPPAHVREGFISLDGVELLSLSEKERRQLRGQRMAMIFQDALTALNPVLRIGWQIGLILRKRVGLGRDQAHEAAVDLLRKVQIPSPEQRANAYPHELSGGMRQRAMIAMALALDPELLIADEPTTALDVTVQAQIMELLATLQQDSGMGLVLITHDLGVVAEVADQIAVMYAGRIVEGGTPDQIFRAPRHPYTSGLMRSIPSHKARASSLSPIVGSPPDLRRLPAGCAFEPRCEYATDLCRAEPPALQTLPEGQTVACHFPEVKDVS